MSFDLLKYLDAADDGNHSEIGASSADRWMRCPASVALGRGVPKRPTSKYALEGTRAHRLAECILAGKVEAWECVGLVPEEMLAGVMLYAEHVWGLASARPSALWVEKEFQLKHLDERAFGTADAVVVKLRELHVVDFKYGAGVAVEVSDPEAADPSGIDDAEIAANPQLLFYALGALCEAGDDYPIQTVHVWVVQPRAVHSAGPIRHATIYAPALVEWGKELALAMRETLNPKAIICPGKHCRWCPAISVCPEQGQLVVADARLDFAEPTITLPIARELTPEQIGSVLTQQPILENWFSTVRENARLSLESGHLIPGWKLVQGRQMRAWADSVKAESYLRSKVGAAAFVSKIVSPAQAEKLTEVPEHLVTVNPSPPSVVPETDKRKPFKPNPVKDFVDA